MQSSFRIIKDVSVLNNGTKEIDTNFKPPVKVDKDNEEVTKNYIDSYESLAKGILEKARIQGETILSEAYSQARQIEEQATQSGYTKGYEAGHKEAYESTMESAKQEAKNIIDEANMIKEEALNMLSSAEKQYEKYLELKKEEIIQAVCDISEKLLMRKIQESDCINSIAKELLSNVKNEKNIIIKCNNVYKEEIEKNIPVWKQELPISGEVFVLCNSDIKLGIVEIEKENGKIVVNIMEGVQKVKEVLFSEDS